MTTIMLTLSTLTTTARGGRDVECDEQTKGDGTRLQ